MDRQHVASGAQRKVSRAAFELVNRAVGRTGALGEHQHAASRGKFVDRLVERFELRALAIERDQAGEVADHETALRWY